MIVSWVKLVWEWLVKWCTKAWDGIKKLPGWAVIAMLACVAVIVYLLKHNLLQRRRAEVTSKLKDITIEYTIAKTEAATRHESEVSSLRDQRNEARKELEDVEDQIEAAAAKGVVGLAQEWKSFMSEGK